MKVEARNQSIDQLFRKWEFIIPDYQREYDWWEEEVSDFWDDINSLEWDDYFIWHMVFEWDFDWSTFKVIDWQQRITTITILLSVIRDCFYKLWENWLWNIINDKYIFSKDVDDNEYLVLNNQMPYPILQKVVQSKPEDKDLNETPKKKWEENIIYIFNFFNEKINDFDIDKLKAIRDIVLNLEIIFVAVSEELDAFTIFETLNAKWKDLTPIDLIKNQIFKNYPKKTWIDEPNDTWKLIKENIKWNDINFLNNFWSSRYKKVSDQKLYKEFIKEYKLWKINIKAFLKDLYNDSIYYNDIINPDSDNWNRDEYEIYFSLNALKTFNIRVTRSILLSLMREYFLSNISKKYYLKALLWLEKFHFINNTICSFRSSWLDTMYAKYSKDLYEKDSKQEKHKVINNLIKSLTEKTPKFDEFDSFFDEKVFYTNKNKKNKKLVDYILQRLELNINNSSSIILKPSVEHLFSQSEKWLKDEIIWNIWNLFLLDSNLNSDLQSKDFKLKKESILKKSSIKSTNEYILKKDKWGEDEIMERRKFITDFYYKNI